MKAFEEWKSENCEAKSCPHEASCNGCENMWRAALEMLSKKIKQITNPPNCRCLLSVQEIIDEELER